MHDEGHAWLSPDILLFYGYAKLNNIRIKAFMISTGHELNTAFYDDFFARDSRSEFDLLLEDDLFFELTDLDAEGFVIGRFGFGFC